jgi:hypothetical protein
MNHVRAVREIARRAPRELRELRGKLMLETVCETLGVEEVPCPACAGTGWVARSAQECCPLCCGFREVPDRLADWFRAQLRRAPADSPERRAGGRPSCERAGPFPPGGRYGRLAEAVYRVHLPSGA